MPIMLMGFGYERVYLPLGKVADTPFYIRGEKELTAESTGHEMLRSAFLASS